jgi:hypothetical protein
MWVFPSEVGSIPVRRLTGGAGWSMISPIPHAGEARENRALPRNGDGCHQESLSPVYGVGTNVRPLVGGAFAGRMPTPVAPQGAPPVPSPFGVMGFSFFGGVSWRDGVVCGCVWDRSHSGRSRRSAW